MSWGESAQNPCDGGSGESVHSHANKTVLDSIGMQDATTVLCGDGIWRDMTSPDVKTEAVEESRQAGEDIERGLITVTINGKAMIADNNTTTHKSLPKSISSESKLKDEIIKIQRIGKLIKAGWELSVNSTYFLSANGEITNAIPTKGFLQRIGVAINSDTLVMDQGIAVKL